MPTTTGAAIYRTSFGRVLTITIGALCAGSLVFTAFADGWADAVVVAPWLALVTLTCWAVFWRPHVEVSDAGVTLVNVTRTIAVPWPAIQDLDTQWALRLVTAYGRYTAWAAPAPGRRGGVTARRLSDVDDHQVLGTPRTPLPGGSGPRPGDLPDTASGDAAMIVRRRWAALRAAGHLDDPQLEHERPRVRWHLDTLAAVVALLALGLITAR